MSILRIFLMLFPLFFFAGCTSYQEHFDCPPKEGVGCRSLSDVDQMVEEGKLPLSNPEDTSQENATSEEKSQPCACKSPPCQEETKKEEEPQFPPPSEIILDNATASPKSPDFWEVERKGEEVIRVWVPSHQDEMGNYHSGAYVYSVLKSGSWEVMK